MTDPDDQDTIRELLSKHLRWTGSDVAAGVLQRWDDLLPRFVKVISKEYKNMLAVLAAEEDAMQREVVTRG